MCAYILLIPNCSPSTVNHFLFSKATIDNRFIIGGFFHERSTHILVTLPKNPEWGLWAFLPQ